MAETMTDQLAARLGALEARQTLLETSNNALENKNSAVKTQVDVVTTKNRYMEDEVRTLMVETQRLTDKINGLNATVSVLESVNKALNGQLSALENKAVDLATDVQQLMREKNGSDDRMVQLQNQSNALTASVCALESKSNSLENDINVLKAENTELKALTTRRVSFHARLTRNQNLLHHEPLKMDKVVTNNGHAYDSSTGLFTAPYSATYCFLASTEASVGSYAAVFLMVDESSVDYGETHSDAFHRVASVHAVVDLNAGQRVWLKSNGNSTFWYGPSAFSGFLVDAVRPFVDSGSGP